MLAVNTAPVELDVTVDHLITLDGHEIERCLVRVTVQLTDRDNYASVAGLAAEYGTELEAYLLQRVETEVAMELHAAVKMNRLADLRRQTVQHVTGRPLAAPLLRRWRAGAPQFRGHRG